MKRKSALLFTLSTLTLLTTGLTSCSDISSSNDSIPVAVEPDSYDMDGGLASIGSKLLDFALSAVSSGIESGVSSVVSPIVSSVIGNILDKIGFSYVSEEQFMQNVLDSLSNINAELEDINKKLDRLSSSFENENYRNIYTNFYSTYTELADFIDGPYKLLMDLEKDIEDKNATNIESQIDDLLIEINPSGLAASEIYTSLTNLAHCIVGDQTSIASLARDNIFEIVYRFAKLQNVYKENQLALFTDAIAAPFTAYSSGLKLASLDFSMKLDDFGIDQIYFAPAIDSQTKELSDTAVTVIGYQYTSDGVSTVYRNCHNNSSDKETYEKYYGDLIKDTTLVEAEPLMINNISGNAYLIANNFSNMLSDYNQICELYDDFITTNGLDKVTIDSSKRTLNAGGSYTQTADKTIKTVWAKDILSVSEISDNGDISIKYDSFGNITKEDFNKFVDDIYNVLQDDDLTFKQFLSNEGFLFPTNNQSSYLILGAEKGLGNYDDYYNNGRKFKNCVAVTCVDINMKISEFVKSHNYNKVYYSLYCEKHSVNSNCGPKFEERWYLFEGIGNSASDYIRNITYGTQDLTNWNASIHNSPIRYYSITDLSNNPKKGTISRTKLSF